jgi:hypothetical protein
MAAFWIYYDFTSQRDIRSLNDKRTKTAPLPMVETYLWFQILAMRNCILLLFLFSSLAFSQMTRGSIQYVIFDTIYPAPTSTLFGGIDTIVGMKDGVETVMLYDNQKPFAYESSRDTFQCWFTEVFVLSVKITRTGKSDLYRLLDISKGKSMNITDNSGTLRKMMTFNFPSDFHKTALKKIPNFYQTTGTDSIFTALNPIFETYQELALEPNSTLNQLEICFTKAIRLPLRLFVNYPDTTSGCPIHYTMSRVEWSTHFQLLRYDTYTKEEVSNDVYPEVLKYLED